jgi:hypothetical protein
MGVLSPSTARDLLQRAFKKLGGDHEQRRSVVARSYAHPNGFDRISLYSDPEGLEVRVHLWWAGVLSDEGIHNHAWDFSSLVLTGSLHFQLLQGITDGEIYDRYSSAMPPGGTVGDYGFTLVDRTSLKVVVDSVAAVGSLYHMHRDTYHRVLASLDGAPMTATIVVRGPVRRGHSYVLVPRGTQMPQTRSMKHLDEDEIMEKLRVLLNVLPEF